MKKTNFILRGLQSSKYGSLRTPQWLCLQGLHNAASIYRTLALPRFHL